LEKLPSRQKVVMLETAKTRQVKPDVASIEAPLISPVEFVPTIEVPLFSPVPDADPIVPAATPICIVCLPLSCHRPWSLRGTKLVGDIERSLRGMQSFNTSRTGNLWRKILEQERALESMPSGMVRHLLHADEVGQVSCEDLGD
jgi:hypothetical protein